ncbi:MAG: polyphosphate:AMP phosphotransferase [Chitinivorax sp.]
MFESAELGHRIDKDAYRQREPVLREALLDIQYELKELSKFPVVVVVGGVDGAGKGETVNLLNSWMDPRLIRTHAFGAPSDEESERPHMWRFWRALPPKGLIGIMFGSWYTDPIVARVEKNQTQAELDQRVEEIVRFEKMLCNEGVLLVKFWFHLSKQDQKLRLSALESNPLTRWRVSAGDWERFGQYDRYRKVSEYVLRQTSTGEAPWIVIEGADERYRALTAGGVLLDSVRRQLERVKTPRQRIDAAPILPPIDQLRLLDRLDLSRKVEKKQYSKRLEQLQGQLNQLVRDRKFRDRSLIVVFEGNDAAGKGGSIRRISAALDARQYQIFPVAAPSEEERAQPYLWRFWRNLPRKGRVAIFDRSWYGRVLVERVEGFCSHADWMRAYAEINEYEQQLVAHGAIIVKFWLAISPDEQLRRFKEREEIGFKRFKITEEDWRNRDKWDDYVQAVGDMVDRTSTTIAPWTLVEANDKYHCRVKVLETLCEAIRANMK